MMRMIFSGCLVAGLTVNVAMAQADKYPDFSPDSEIGQGLLNVAVADKIRKKCDTISARTFTALSYVNGLKRQAAELGHSSAEVNAYIKDPEEKVKRRARRNAYFKSKGASKRDPESLCALGRDEIQNKSQIGLLLKAK